MLASGSVEGLYAHHAGKVIRTSASFDFGSSGGGLFDEAGNLVGLLGLKARSGKNLRFALPVESVQADALAFRVVDADSKGDALWARPKQSQPELLGVAVQEAAR